MRYTLIIALFLLTACDKLPMTRKAEVRTSTITWIKETPKTCGPVPVGHRLNACASNTPDFSACTITMPENTPDSTIGEEFRHCFGEVHPK